jgi:hypothetical protein
MKRKKMLNVKEDAGLRIQRKTGKIFNAKCAEILREDR